MGIAKLFGEVCGSWCEVADIPFYHDMFSACGRIVEEVVGDTCFELGLQVGIVDEQMACEGFVAVGAVDVDIAEGVVVVVEMGNLGTDFQVGLRLLPQSFEVYLGSKLPEAFVIEDLAEVDVCGIDGGEETLVGLHRQLEVYVACS